MAISPDRVVGLAKTVIYASESIIYGVDLELTLSRDEQKRQAQCAAYLAVKLNDFFEGKTTDDTVVRLLGLDQPGEDPQKAMCDLALMTTAWVNADLVQTARIQGAIIDANLQGR